MGFFDALSKIVQGKPVFEANQGQQKPSEQVSSQPTPQTPGQPVGPKVYPIVKIDRVQCETPGNNLQCDVYIKNYSATEVDVDRFEFFGGSPDLGTFLRPGESREFRVYNGPRPRSNNQHNCKIYFKDATGDYFCSENNIQFRQLPDGTYSIDRIDYLRTQDI